MSTPSKFISRLAKTSALVTIAAYGFTALNKSENPERTANSSVNIEQSILPLGGREKISDFIVEWAEKSATHEIQPKPLSKEAIMALINGIVLAELDNPSPAPNNNVHNTQDLEIQPQEINSVGADYSGHILTNTTSNFEEGKLAQSNFSKAIINGVSFTKADMESSKIIDATIFNSDFSEAKLGGADFYASTLFELNFSDSDLKNGVFTNSEIDDANFEGASLQNTIFKDTIITNTNFKGVDLSSVNFEGASISDKTIATNREGITAAYVRSNLALISEAEKSGKSITKWNKKDIHSTLKRINKAGIDNAQTRLLSQRSKDNYNKRVREK